MFMVFTDLPVCITLLCVTNKRKMLNTLLVMDNLGKQLNMYQDLSELFSVH